ERVKSAAGNIGHVERGRAGAANPRSSTHHQTELLEISRQHLHVLEREASADEAATRLAQARNADALAVEECSAALRRGEFVFAGDIEHGAGAENAIAGDGDGDRVLR